MNQVAQRNNHVLQVLKRLKDTLDNDKKKYADKVNILVMTWERIAASAKEHRPLAAICIVEKMYKDTLNIMLQGEWPKMSPVSKTHLMQMLNRCRTDLCKEMPWLNSKFRKLLELVNDPWTLPSLERILHKDPCPATPEQIIEFCESERGLLIVTRLTMLCSSRCEKVAIKLAEACFGALTGGNTVLLSLFTTNEYNFIFDIYLCLLFKYKKLECIINALKTVSVTDGYYLVVRLRKRNDLHEQKIWKFSHQVAAVASRYFITVSMLSRTVPNSLHLKNLISDWLSMCKEDNIESEIRKIMQPAETSEHIYIMAEVLTTISQQLGNQIYSSLIVELYIRALTADINYLERVKLQNDKEQMTAYEKHLASKFLALADLVKDHSGVRREFVLTAFSIHPSPENYRRVEEEAIASGKASPHSTSQESLEVGVLSEGLSSLSSEEPEGKETATEFSVNNDSQDSGAFVEISNRCPLHIPYDGIGPEGTLCFQCGDFTGRQSVQSPTHQQKKKERSLDALILIKGSTVTESLNYDALSAPSQVLEAEKLGLSSQVCADLVTLLGSNRYHLLTWVLEWGELSSRCLRYMNEADTIKSGKKELKFLEIDYNQYKDWPENEDEADCIEKGYEQWLEDDESELDTDSKRSNTDDSEELMLKTAIKRSQKQMGRYAESSSDSEDSRSRPRPRKRGRPRKRLKSFSDSGSVSDSLGSDGQKQNRPSKKPRTKSKDLRKTLGRLKVLEMRENINNLSSGNDCFPSELLGSKMFGLPTSATARSDPTVLKSLRAFRPNAHKTKNDEFIQSVTENMYSSKTASGKIVSSKNTAIFDCNDNKFVSQGERFTFGGKDMELHFRTGGVRTKKYNDVIRTIKEDLISVSNIPNVANNATVNVVHVQNCNSFENSSQNVQTSTEGQSVPVAPSVVAGSDNLPSSVQKPKQENETQGSQARKPNSSQSLSQNAEASSNTTAPPATILSSALTRSNSTSRPVIIPASNNQFFTTAVVRPGTKVGGQPQYMAIVNRNSLNQINASSNQVQTTDCQNVPNSVVGFITTSNVRNLGQNFTTQASRTPIQPGTRVVAVSALDPSRFVLDNERPNVILSRNYGVQNNNRAGISTLYNHVTLGTNNNSGQIKRVEDSNCNSAKQNVSVRSEGSTQNVSFANTTADVTNATKVTIATSKPMNIQRPSNETVTFNVTPSSSVFLNTTKPSNLRFSTESETPYFNKSIMQLKNSVGTSVPNRVPSQVLSDNNSKTQTVIFQTSANKYSSLGDVTGVKRSFHLTSNPLVKIQSSNNAEGATATAGSQSSDAKCLSTTASEVVAPRSELINNVSGLSPLTLDVRNISSVLTTTSNTATTNGNTNYGSSNLGSNKSYNEVVNIIQGMPPLHDGTTLNTAETNSIDSTNRTAVGESGEVIAIIDPPPAVKLNSTNVLPARNILATVLKRNSFGQVSSPMTSSIATQYSVSNARNPMEMSDHCEAIQNVMVSQSSSSSTIHYTVVNPLQQEQVQQDSLNSSTGDMIERIVKEEDFNSPEAIKSSVIGQIKSSEYTGETMSAGLVGSVGELKVIGQQQQQQLIGQENKKGKPVSSPLTVQGENNLPKKQVLNNQKITILVQNNEQGNGGDKVDQQQRNKLNELLFRDDQKTCITFRAIKRTQPEGNPDLKDKSKKGSQDVADDQNNDREILKQVSVPKETDFTSQGDSGSSEPLCQYLVLEAVNDPSGALPKFNQAFGKSYQIKLPQAIKPVTSNETGGNEANYSIVDQEKIDTKTSSEPRVGPLHDHTQVPATVESSIGGNAFEIVQKQPVKTVYIDKDTKTTIQKSPKAEEETLESPNISAMQIAEGEQQQQPQPGVDGHQFNTPKVARSSVVQQLLRKVPTTGPPTLQAVNSINTLTSRQVKAQDVVSGSTLIYATETRAQSQIVIQRAVGRVNGPTISQVAPVIYTQNLSDQSAPQTQTLLLAAVPSGTRGVVPGAQLVRIPSSSGVWKMAPSVNPPRIVQLRPQNLVLQGGQDQQSLLMQSGQPVLLHHLTSLPVKPIGVVSSDTKTDQTPKIDVKNEVYSKPELNIDDAKICSVPLEVDQTSTKSETSSPAAAVSEHETVSLMKDIKEFENVFEETKLKFEMEKQQGVCPQEIESISQSKTLTAVHQGTSAQADHQTVLVQPQLMLHKPQMIITSAIPNQQAIFTQKIDKPLTLEKDTEKRLILTTKPKIGVDESSQSHVAVAYVSHSPGSSVNVQKPLVVVTNYAQPPSSPSPSITSQNSSSPNSVVSSVSFTGTSTSSGKTSNKSKSRNIKAVPNPSKSPPVAKPQQKPQEDANTAQKIYAILEEYAVQLRNSPDMNNRPAPRRRSNPPTSTNTKRKKTVCKSKESFLDGEDTNFVEDGTEPLSISEDSSSGVTVLQVCVSSSH